MLKYLATLLFLFSLPILSIAQQPAAVKGNIYDTAAKRGLAYATI